jgi:hypothetical protein
LPRSEDFEVAKPDKARGNTTHNRAWLMFCIAIVKHIAQYILSGRNQTQGTRRRDAERVHRFAA